MMLPWHSFGRWWRRLLSHCASTKPGRCSPAWRSPARCWYHLHGIVRTDRATPAARRGMPDQQSLPVAGEDGLRHDFGHILKAYSALGNANEGVTLSQQEQTSPPPASQGTPAPVVPLPKQPPASTGFWSRFTIPLFAVLIAFAFIALATQRWDEWVGSATIQTTNDAYIRAELTRLSSRVAGEVLTVAVKDFQHVKAGDLLVQIDPADYEAQVAQAEAGVAGAQAALDNLDNQVELQYATIAQAEAQLVSAAAQEVEARQEQERQQSLSQTESGTRQKLEQATAGYARAQADVRASRALIAAQRHQLEVLSGTKKQRAADIEAAKATLAAAHLKLGYTKIVAPFDGVVGERQVQPGD